MTMPADTSFDPHCTRCPRLAEFLAEGKRQYPQYHCAPVAPFGAPDARLVIVGLAPGFHGANATGRPFTGDYAGILLYETLYAFGLSTGPQSVSAGDGLRLVDCRISNSVNFYLGDPSTQADNYFISADVTRVVGPHPIHESDFALFCDVVTDILG